MKRTTLACLLLGTCGLIQAQGGYRYNHLGQLVNGRGDLANPHQQMHDMANPRLWTTGAVAVSNTVDPNFQQANLQQIEAAIAPIIEPGGQGMSRLYLTPTNPYTPGVGDLHGSPPGRNHDHYQQILLDAPVGGYVSTDSGAYIARTQPGSSVNLRNWGFHTYEANPKFLAALEASGGQGGGVAFFVNQSAQSLAHVRAISGSNLYMTAYVRPHTGGAIALGGQIVLNAQHNTDPSLNTAQYGPAFTNGLQQIHGQTQATGNEHGFWVMGTGSQTQIADWGDGSASSIVAAYNPAALFHVHTHPSQAGPSYADMVGSAMLGGMPGMVVSGSGNYVYGFQVEGGMLPTHNGMVVFEGGRFDAQSGAGYGSQGHGGMDGIGHNVAGSTTTTTTVSGGAAFGMGAEVSVTTTTVKNPRGETVNVQVSTTGLVSAGVSAPGANVVGSTKPGIHLNEPGISPTAQVSITTPIGNFQANTDLSNPNNSSVSFEFGTGKPGATASVGATHHSSVYGPQAGYHSGTSGPQSGGEHNSSYSSGAPSSSANPNNPGSFASPGY